jgi:flagellar basal body-associated protein FliL
MTAASPPATPPADAAAPAAKKPGLLVRLLPMVTLVIGAVAGGAGAAIGLVAAGGLGGGGGAAAPAHHPPEPVQYVEIDNAFTSNLVDTGRYLQLRLSVSTTGGEEVVAEIEKHKPALVSAVLAVLGDLSEADVADRAAKDKLRGRLRTAVNEVLKAKGEGATIEDVFLTSLVVQ